LQSTEKKITIFLSVGILELSPLPRASVRTLKPKSLKNLKILKT